MKIVEFSTHRRVTVAMLMVAVIAFGLVGFQRLELNLLPDMTYPTITIRTEYEGAAPQEVERLLSEPIEGLVGVVNNVLRVSSISRPGFSDVIVEFAWGTDMNFASLDIREKLDIAQLPHDAERPVLLRFDPSLDPVMRIALHGGRSLMELRHIAEERLRFDLESLAGVAAVRVEGGHEEEIQVEVESKKLADLGVSMDQVVARLAAENVNMTGGLLKDGEAEFMVRTLNEFEDIDDIAKIVVANLNGAVVKLSDVGQVRRGHRELDVITRVDGREAVELAIFKEGDANTVRVHEVVVERLEAFRDNYADLMSSGTVLEVIVDQASFIRQAVNEVLKTALVGGVLAVFVLYLFLRNLKSTVIISLSIPISVVATFFLMFSTDASLNIMSLGGLALGVGMLVDSSIVVLESIERRRAEGLSVLEAARAGAGEVGRAVVAATVTTVCVFLPIVFVEGVAGQLFRDQALTVTYSLTASLFVALMLIPMLSSWSLPRVADADTTASGLGVRAPAVAVTGLVKLVSAPLIVIGWILRPLSWAFDAVYARCSRLYPLWLGYCLHRRAYTLGGFALLSVLILHQSRDLGLELIPQMSHGEFLVDLEWPSGQPVEHTATHVAGLEHDILELSAVETVFSLVGATGETGGYADEQRENLAQLFVSLRAVDQRAGMTEAEVMERVRQVLSSVPDLKFEFSRPSYFSFRTPIEVEVAGHDLEALRHVAASLALRMQQIPGLVDVKSSAAGGQPEVQVLFDRNRVAELGTGIQAIGDLLRQKLQGEVSTELKRKDRRIDIRVRAVEEERRDLADLKELVVSPPQFPTPVPLGAIADVTIVEGPAQIRRLDQERVALVTANLAGRDLGSAVAEIEATTASMPVPGGFRISVGGQNEEMVRSFDSMKFALLLAIFLVYLVMASQFESLLHPLVIMFTIPFGVVGSALFLSLTGQTVSVVVLIGAIMLAGIVVNNAIVLIDHINQLRLTGMPKLEAVQAAAQHRFRPILMTTSTTVLALLPMALGIGEGAEIRAPMAVTVVGGLLVSTALTLIVMPVVYVSLDRSK